MPDDGFRYEFVKGELRRRTPAGNVHGRVTMNVGISLGGYVKAHDLGAVYAAETGFRLSSDPDSGWRFRLVFAARCLSTV